MSNLEAAKLAAPLIGSTLLCSSALLWAQAGSLDPAFGNNGIVITPNTGTATAMAFQSDSKIVVAGLIRARLAAPSVARRSAESNTI